MADLVELALGKPWPYPIAGEGLQLVLDPGAEAPSAMLVAGVSRPTYDERLALSRGPLRIGILPSPPLVWIALDASKISLDAPYALGLAGAQRSADVLASAAKALSWPDGRAGLITLAVVDLADGVTRGLRAVSLSRPWWIALHEALSCCPQTLSAYERDQAMARDYRRWPDTGSMLAQCTAIELAGRVI